MAVEIVNRQRLVAVAPGEIARLAQDVMSGLRRSGAIAASAGITIAIIRSEQMRRLNRTYRGRDADTDVLSFPAGRDHGEADEPYLGDVVICADAVLRQASEAGLSIERELSELVIHGVLHLAGYDHEVDAGEMNRLEMQLRRRLLDSRRLSRKV